MNRVDITKLKSRTVFAGPYKGLHNAKGYLKTERAEKRAQYLKVPLDSLSVVQDTNDDGYYILGPITQREDTWVRIR